MLKILMNRERSDENYRQRHAGGQERTIIMTKIKKHVKKDGTKAYMFQTYLGKDPKTGKSKKQHGEVSHRDKKLLLLYLA